MISKHGFVPAHSKAAMQRDEKNLGGKCEKPRLVSKAAILFRRVPVLAALFGEVVAFQSLSTILNVCFVRQLKETIPLDTERASFTGRFYALINGLSCLMQFFVLPAARKFLEPRWVYRLISIVLIPILGYLTFLSFSFTSAAKRTLMITAGAFFTLKTMDYSLRNVVNEMVYQPLDFESRYLGKEVIGVFANRFGKSGISLFLSFATATFPVGIPQLSLFSFFAAYAWASCAWLLSMRLPSNVEAELQVQELMKQD